MGDLVLRSRWDPSLELDVLEIKLGDEFLMSSLFTVAEEQMARLTLAEIAGTGFDVLVGGLGLGYTAQAVLEDRNVRSLVVIESLDAVIGWHQRGLIPAGESLTSDPRCTLQHADLFAMLRAPWGGVPTVFPDRFHAVVVDIDHSPRHLLHPSHADLYEPAGLRRLADRLHPGGVFALWSNDPPDNAFTGNLEQIFARVEAVTVSFDNPLQNREDSNTVYLAKMASAQ